MTRLIYITWLTLLLHSPFSISADVLPAPDGYTWKRVAEVKAAFLVPDGWNYQQDRKGNTLGVFITRESIPSKGKYDTGMGINIFPKDINATKQLLKALVVIAERYKSNISKAEFGPFVRFYTQHDSIRSSDGENIRAVHIVVANSNTNSTYYIVFESPVPLWDKFWPVGDVLVNNLVLETEF